ncbi:hypothetical protein DFH11DRAFT_1849016 [Phellopilus nigrolimitatus]|nr:hypothetical protein DFH11DRAFT_1849016 [Phellopilus nigrolimitatus]
MPTQLQHYASSFTSHRVLLYSVFSIGAVLAVIANALKKHSNFYSVAVYLSKSNGTVVVLANFGLLLALLSGRLMQQIFFGPLRAMEVERLYDRMWFFVTESLLAFTIFRDEFDIPFALMFGLLLFTKCFHWLLSDRIEWMDQRPYPGPPMLFHVRIHLLVALLWATDLVAFLFTIENMLTNGVGGTVLFASEYAILLASLTNSVAKYCIALVDLRRASLRGGENAPPWEDKSMLVFYVELATDFLKLVTYLTFFMLVLTFYGLPLNIVRDVYITARSFIVRFRDLMRYRTATRNMDERYPNATEAELTNMSDRTCIICREEMIFHAAVPTVQEGGQQSPAAAAQDGPNTTPKKLPCGHIFHFYCLRSWLERQQSCPTCRRSVLETDQTPRANGQAAVPRPQPGAPNGAGPAQQLQWQLQQGNRGGIFGRLMGAAGMPPVAPGQLAPGAFPGQAPEPNNIANGNGLGWEGQQGPLAYAPPNPFMPQPFPYPRQPERFQGFWAPDGVWHPWPNAQNNANVNVNDQQQEAPVPTPTVPSPTGNASIDGSITNEGSSTSPTLATPSPSSAREAAAAAALRRFSPSAKTTIRRLLHKRPSPALRRPCLIPASLASTPALIPLYDPRVTSPPLSHGLSRPFFPRSSSYRSPSDRIPSARQSIQNMRDLPASLTDEQLSVLDQLTREAIDERLRILENVQATTARCTMELLRCRSALPRSSGSSSAPMPRASPPPSERASSSGSQNASRELHDSSSVAPAETGGSHGANAGESPPVQAAETVP